MEARSHIGEQHPPSVRARLVRCLRGLRRVRGWERIANMLVDENSRGSFVVANPTGRFAGDLSSFIERRVYLFGGYEEELIEAFVALVPEDRRGTILDVGANVGTHSLAFARHFGSVHAFEPNRLLWGSLDRNIRMNGLSNVQVHTLGLADRDEELDFYLIDKPNYGLGTCSNVEQYDLPLAPAGRVNVVRGDRYLSGHGIARIDAVKIDVQGFEPQVIRGLRDMLRENRPYVWLEIGSGTMEEIDTLDRLRGLFPYPVRVPHLSQRGSRVLGSARLTAVAGGSMAAGDYVVAPLGG